MAILRSPRMHAATLLAGGWLALLSLWAAAQSPTLSAADRRDIQEVVQAQLDAFAVDDAKRAYDLADAGVRKRFGDAHAFLAMVRTQYPMVHRPATVSFLQADSERGVAIQRVRMTGADGSHWLVTYLLQNTQRQWRISACIVVPDAPRLTT
jgi:hypothetical protein